MRPVPPLSHALPRAAARAAVVALLLPLALGAAAEPPEIYKWVDENGIAHYTTDPERIPSSLRDRIRSIRRGEPPAPAPAPTREPAEPTEASAPSPETPAAAAEAEAPAPRPAIEVPPPATTPSGDAWFERDAVPRVDTSAILAAGEATPSQLEALAAEQAALDERIAELQAEIARDERFLKGLISDPDLESDVPLFDRPDFLEVSERLPQLQARLQELRDERAKLELP